MTETIFRLSPQQLRQQMIAPQARVRCSFRLAKPTATAAVQTALARVVEAHEILRTDIRRVPQGCFQFVRETFFPLEQRAEALPASTESTLAYALHQDATGAVTGLSLACAANLMDAGSALILSGWLGAALRQEALQPLLQYGDLFDPDASPVAPSVRASEAASVQTAHHMVDLSAMRSRLVEHATRWGVSLDACLMALSTSWLKALGHVDIHLRFDARRDPELAAVLGCLDHDLLWAHPSHADLRLQGLAALIDFRLQQEATVDSALQAAAVPDASAVVQVLRSLRDPDVALCALDLDDPMHQMAFRWIDDGERLQMQWQYGEASVAAASSVMFLAALPTWIDAALTQQPLARIGFGSDALTAWYQRQGQISPADSLKFDSLPAAIAHWAGVTPDATALVSDHSAPRSYASLHLELTQIGNALRQRGVLPGQSVAVVSARSEAHVLAMLAIMAAGAIYVPIDPHHPRQRNQRVLNDADVALVLSDAPSREAAWVADRDCTDLISLRAKVSNGNPLALPLPQSVAYLVYTSGTTGKPKGVAVSHGAVVAYAAALINRLESPFAARYASLSTLAADLGYTSLFAAFFSGGSYAVLDDSLMLDGMATAGTLERLAVDYLKIVPSHWLALDEQARAGGATGVYPRQGLIFGGDRLDGSIVGRIRESAASIKVFNHYGPTETTVGVLGDEAPQVDGSVPLGRPLQYGSARVLDMHDALCLPGHSGELAFSGPTLAHGYWRQPSATAERFRPDPHAMEFGARLYRTGDFGHIDGNGCIWFEGRRDEQLKIGGQRVDLGEVHAALQSLLPDQLVYVLADTRAAHPQLRGYVRTAGVVNVHALTTQLRELLPEHMQLASIVAIPAMPLNANGKVDRAALLALSDRFDQGSTAEPTTETERWLQALWSNLLEIDRTLIGRTSNFFRIGGHSLLAARMLAKVRAETERDISIRSFFEHATLEQFAGLLDAQSAERTVQWLQVAPMRTHYPLSLGQERLWSIAASGQDDLAYNSAYGLRLRGALDVPRLVAALQAVIMRHQPLHSLIISDAEGRPQSVLQLAPVPVALHDLRGAADADTRQESVLRGLRDRPFQLDQELPIRVGLLQLEDQFWRLLLVVHHIAWDGWSNAVFLGELLHAYQHGAETLPELPLQYGDLALSERASLGHARIERALQYWDAALHGLPTLDLRGIDYNRPRTAFQGAMITTPVPKELMPKLDVVVTTHGLTRFMLGLAVWYLTLHRHTGQLDLAIGTSSANRSHPDLEQLIGFFVNQLVLRATVAPEQRFDALLVQVQQTVLRAFEHDGAPFGSVVARLSHLRRPGRSPLYQSMFVMQSPSGPMPEVPGLSLEMEVGSVEHAKFDLTLYLQEMAAGQMQAVLVYDQGLIQATHAAQILDDYLSLLADALNDSSVTVAALMQALDRRRDLAVANKKFQGLRSRSNSNAADKQTQPTT